MLSQHRASSVATEMRPPNCFPNSASKNLSPALSITTLVFCPNLANICS